MAAFHFYLLLWVGCFWYWNSSSLILATRSSRIVSYDVKTKKTRHLEIRHPGLRRETYEESCEIYHYKDSLVTLKRGNGEQLDPCNFPDATIEV